MPENAEMNEEALWMATPKRYRTKIVRNRVTGCWAWIGASMKDRKFRRAEIGHGKLAYRELYKILVGPIPPGKQCNHHCDNGLCVNPNHLFIGTQKDNLQDASRKGRLKRKK